MTEQLYRVKPLVFVKSDGRLDQFEELWVCHDVERLIDDIYEVGKWDGHDQWRYAAGASFADCDSLEHGKQLCQQHFESVAGIGRFLDRPSDVPYPVVEFGGMVQQ